MTVDFLSDAWFSALVERAEALPERAGVDLLVAHEIAGAPDGKVRFVLEWRDGRLVRAEIGKATDADLMVQASAVDARRLMSGTVEVEVAWMQGRVKIDGAYGRLLIEHRAWRTSPEMMDLWREMAELTTPA